MISRSPSPHQYFEKKKILVTGSSGYIASAIVGALSGIQCTIYRMSRTVGRHTILSSTARIKDLEADLSSEDDWKYWLKDIDIVFHLAAQTSSYKADRDPLGDFRSNVFPMLRMLMACENNGYKPIVIFSGTVTQIGLSNRLPVNEKHYEAPITIYDIHKLMAEKYLCYYASRGIVRGCVLRLSNVYGPGPESGSKDRGILNLMVKKALSGKPLSVFGTGEQVRDYIYIDDVVQAFILAATHIDKANANYFIIGSGTGHTIGDAIRLVAETAFEKTAHRVEIKQVEPPPDISLIEERNFVADIKQFFDCTGWKPQYSLYEGIRRTIDHYLTNCKEK